MCIINSFNTHRAVPIFSSFSSFCVSFSSYTLPSLYNIMFLIESTTAIRAGMGAHASKRRRNWLGEGERVSKRHTKHTQFGVLVLFRLNAVSPSKTSSEASRISLRLASVSFSVSWNVTEFFVNRKIRAFPFSGLCVCVRVRVRVRKTVGDHVPPCNIMTLSKIVIDRIPLEKIWRICKISLIEFSPIQVFFLVLYVSFLQHDGQFSLLYQP